MEQHSPPHFDVSQTDTARQAGDDTAQFLESGASLVVVTVQNWIDTEGRERSGWNLVARWPASVPAPEEWENLSHDEQLAKFGFTS